MRKGVSSGPQPDHTTEIYITDDPARGTNPPPPLSVVLRQPMITLYLHSCEKRTYAATTYTSAYPRSCTTGYLSNIAVLAHPLLSSQHHSRKTSLIPPSPHPPTSTPSSRHYDPPPRSAKSPRSNNPSTPPPRAAAHSHAHSADPAARYTDRTSRSRLSGPFPHSHRGRCRCWSSSGRGSGCRASGC